MASGLYSAELRAGVETGSFPWPPGDLLPARCGHRLW